MYAGLKKAENFELDRDGYTGSLEAVPYWVTEDLCSTCENAMYAAKFATLPSSG